MTLSSNPQDFVVRHGMCDEHSWWQKQVAWFTCYGYDVYIKTRLRLLSHTPHTNIFSSLLFLFTTNNANV